MRFRAEQHLRRQLDIQHVRQSGRRQECGGFTLWWARRAATPAGVPLGTGPRVAVVASRAAVGGAVQRNRAKRRLREVFRHHQQRVPPDIDLLLVARSSLNRLEYREIERKFIRTCATLFPSSVPDA
jgi:ribonuclease P protein component